MATPTPIITWDDRKRAINLAERRLDFAMVTPAFFEAAQIAPAKNGRFIAVGTIGPATYAVIFAPLGTEAISVISLRRASRKEQRMLR